MGKMIISGSAERKIICDMINISLTFRAMESTTASAAVAAKQHCEEFLTKMQENGIDLSKIKFSQEEIDSSYSNREEQIFEAFRTIEFTMQYDMPFLNQLNDWISEVSYPVAMNARFYFSHPEKIQKELLREAVEDARQKAEMLAEMMHQKVIDLEEVSACNFHQPYTIGEAEASVSFGNARTKSFVSDQLKAPERTETESVQTTWIIE